MSADGTDDPNSPRTPETVVAAGGVVLDGSGDTASVLVVHRPAYDDWSLPKGHLDPGETPVVAALREVAEETGVRAHIIGEAGTTEHPVTVTVEGTRRPAQKVVHWFVMRPEPDAHHPADRPADREVDRATWWPVGSALVDLTHAGERTLLARVLDADH